MGTYLEALKAIPGLTHYFPLTSDCLDKVGTLNGVNHGATFSNGHAVFNGSSSIELPNSTTFSPANPNGTGMTVVVTLAITDWRGKGGNGEYVHWTGKGQSGAHEWIFRHYVKGSTAGEAPARQGRTSFYSYNPAGGLGAGSYYQDPAMPTTERLIVGSIDKSPSGYTTLYVDGTQRDKDALSGYSITPTFTNAPPFLGTRGDGTGYLIGTMRRVAFFNRVLTPAEVSTIWAHRGDPETPPVSPPPVSPPPVSPPPVSPPPPPTAPTLEKYVVQPGDTQASIATKFGVTPDRVRQITPWAPVAGESVLIDRS